MKKIHDQDQSYAREIFWEPQRGKFDLIITDFLGVLIHELPFWRKS